VVAYELLTGEVPFTGETSLAIAYKHLSGRVPAPSKAVPEVPPSLDSLVLGATEKDRDRRPDSAAELRRELSRAASSLPPATPLPELVRSLPAAGHPTADERAATVTIPRMVTSRTRRRRRVRRVVATLLVLAAVLGAAWGVWTYLIPHYTQVPNVLGEPLADARAALEEAGLDVEIGTPITSTVHEDGEVARQSVEGGLRVRTGTDVVLRPSKGLPILTVPSLSGKNLIQAENALGDVDLQVGVVTDAYHERVPEGNVIEQNPRAGSEVPFGTRVDVTISLGPEPVPVPSLVGLSSDEASAVLLNAGLGVDLRQEYSVDVPFGEVIRQRPGANTPVAEDTTVIVWISLGPRQFEMPGVVGMGVDEARAQLVALGLEVRIVEIPGSDGNEVVSQLPVAGATVEAGQEVTIYVA
jgi:beta-lactam-binding protein with PASTA domain